jgi:predicted esterase
MKSLSGNILLVFSTVLFKSSQKQVLTFLLATIICTGRCYSQDRDAKILTVPEIEEGSPEAGKRVKIYLSEYPEAYYVLFLPYNFTDTIKIPIIFESPGNVYQEISNGLPDSACLGYGISFGMDYIWVGVPFIDNTGSILRSYWGKDDPLSTVNFWLAVLNDLNARFRIDNDKIILSGFSRGAVSTSYIGNYNDEISSKWAAYFAHSHFDGCCQTLLGNTDERISRIQKKKVLISVGGHDIAKKCSRGSYERLLKGGYDVTYIEVPDLDHSPFWILENSESAQKARDWLQDLFTN